MRFQMVAATLGTLPGIRLNLAAEAPSCVSQPPRICSPKGCQTIPGVVAPMRASHSVTYLFLSVGQGLRIGYGRRGIRLGLRLEGVGSIGTVIRGSYPRWRPENWTVQVGPRPEKSSHWSPPTETVPARTLNSRMASGKIRRDRVGERDYAGSTGGETLLEATRLGRTRSSDSSNF